MGLILVILVWGVSPFFTMYFFNYISPTVQTAFNALVSTVSLLIISRKNLHLLNKDYFKVAVPTGLFYSIAHIMQTIGLQYTTPTKYSFLENLSCVIVPVLLYFFIKKKPSFLTITASLLCLASTFILNGLDFSAGTLKFGIGEVLCALAGIFYGVNIAGTGTFAKKLQAPLYLTVQMAVELFCSILASIAFNYIKIGGAVIEPIEFSFNIWVLLLRAISAFLCMTLCWLIRTSALKHVDATIVAVMMPFSAVITTIISICLGSDKFTLNLVVGVVLGLIAIIFSGLGDRTKPESQK